MQSEFNKVHSTMIKIIMEETDDNKKEELNKLLFTLIKTYNQFCRAKDIPIVHKTNLKDI